MLQFSELSGITDEDVHSEIGLFFVAGMVIIHALEDNLLNKLKIHFGDRIPQHILLLSQFMR